MMWLLAIIHNASYLVCSLMLVHDFSYLQNIEKKIKLHIAENCTENLRSLG